MVHRRKGGESDDNQDGGEVAITFEMEDVAAWLTSSLFAGGKTHLGVR